MSLVNDRVSDKLKTEYRVCETSGRTPTGLCDGKRGPLTRKLSWMLDGLGTQSVESLLHTVHDQHPLSKPQGQTPTNHLEVVLSRPGPPEVRALLLTSHEGTGEVQVVRDSDTDGTRLKALEVQNYQREFLHSPTNILFYDRPTTHGSSSFLPPRVRVGVQNGSRTSRDQTRNLGHKLSVQQSTNETQEKEGKRSYKKRK